MKINFTKYLLVQILCIAIAIESCKKKTCNERYTISGQILNGTTGARFYNVKISMVASDGDFNKGKKGNQFRELGTTLTDSFGKFSLTYGCSDFPGNEVYITSDLMELGYIPYSQDFNKIWYNSSFGTLKLVLNTNARMSNLDTLFLWHRDMVKNKSVIDTFRNLPNSYQIYYRVTPGSMGFYYGRGSKEFIYDFQKDAVKYSKGSGSKYVTGDPIVDSLILNY